MCRRPSRQTTTTVSKRRSANTCSERTKRKREPLFFHTNLLAFQRGEHNKDTFVSNALLNSLFPPQCSFVFFVSLFFFLVYSEHEKAFNWFELATKYDKNPRTVARIREKMEEYIKRAELLKGKK